MRQFLFRLFFKDEADLLDEYRENRKVLMQNIIACAELDYQRYMRIFAQLTPLAFAMTMESRETAAHVAQNAALQSRARSQDFKEKLDLNG